LAPVLGKTKWKTIVFQGYRFSSATTRNTIFLFHSGDNSETGPCHNLHESSHHEIIRGAFTAPNVFRHHQEPRARYCPSIEDKIVRFADKVRHQIFLGPEGLETVESPKRAFYKSTTDVQVAMVHSIEGGRSRVMRPNYTIEYDYVEPTQLYPR
jgi:tRNA uridine 5-carboxymethylaminomethyl modification enzyme